MPCSIMTFPMLKRDPHVPVDLVKLVKKDERMNYLVSRFWHISQVAISIVAVLLLFSPPVAAQGSDSPRRPGAARCEALGKESFAAVPDAPTTLTSTTLVEASDSKPAHCEVEGYVAPQVGILMWLPTQNWNGKFLQVGCGGFCGTFVFMRDCVAPLGKGYACVTTDMGHKGNQGGGVAWAYNNPQAVIDFAYRATHVTALAGKAILHAYYGRKSDRSYFRGCSAGGRQGLIEAQRFPWDFDGVIAGAPAISYSDISFDFAYRERIFRDARGIPLFDAGAKQLLFKAVRVKCDMNDGVKDGLIGDPRLCRFDPQVLLCKAGTTSQCLTKAQADAATALYKTDRSVSGERLGQAAYPVGVENAVPLVARDARPFYEDFFKYMALQPNPGPEWTFEKFDREADYQRLGEIQGLMDATNPDFSRFKRAGGKLILHHGWADSGLSANASVELYESIQRAMGGRIATQEFMRLFMVPDTDHCGGGPGANAIDYLEYLDKWVVEGSAPDSMIAAHHTEKHLSPAPATDTAPKFTRPVYPYPLYAKYKGSGDPNDASSFRAFSLMK